MTSNKMTYVVAGSVVGTLGYLLLTDSGKKTLQSIRHFDADTVPDKIDAVHGAVERGTRAFSRRLQAARERITDSIDAGCRAYGDANSGYQF